MTRLEFCNVITHYISNDDMAIAIRIISKICEIDSFTVIAILAILDDRLLTERYIRAHRPNHDKRRRIIGKLIYAELMNYHGVYSFSGWMLRDRIREYNFKVNFETI